jgi:hypothetical protein
VALATLLQRGRGSLVARVERTRRLGVASRNAKGGRFESRNEGEDSNAGSQTPKG